MTTTIENTAPGRDVVDRVISDSRAVAEAAEAIIWNLADGQMPTAEERNVLRLAGLVDRNDLEREQGRVAFVKQQLARAGSKDEFLAAQKSAIAAAKVEADRRPELEAQLEKIQAELESLKRARLAAAAVANRMEDARANLREPRLLPQFIRDSYETDRAALRANKCGRRISELAHTIKLIDALQKIDDPDNARLHCEAIELIESRSSFEEFAVGAITRKLCGPPGGNQQIHVSIDMEAFRSYARRRLEKERPLLEHELMELKHQQRDSIDALDAKLNYYVDRL
jgi:hypothetical protein